MLKRTEVDAWFGVRSGTGEKTRLELTRRDT